MEKIIDNLSEEDLKSLIKSHLISEDPKLSLISKSISSFSPSDIKEKAKLNTIIQSSQKDISTLHSMLDELEKPEIKTLAPKHPIRVYIDGVFDIIHSGHFNAIRQAKKLGDILVVGVNSDSDVMKVKGPTLMNQNERAALAAACKWTDEVAVGTLYTPTIQMLDDLKCDYCSHGDDIPYNENGESCYDEIM